MKLTRAALVFLAGACLRAPSRADEAPPPTVIESAGPGEMVSTDTESTFTFRDQVVVTGNNLKITCDLLVVVAKRTGDPVATLGKQENFKSLLATGHVRIVQGDREATCGRAEVLPHEDKVVLTEDPVVVDHDTGWTNVGEKITMWRGERRVVVDKPRLTGPALKDLGFDKTKPVPPPDAPATPDQPK